MNKLFPMLFICMLMFVLLSGCASMTPDRLPSEDIEVFEKYSDIISILRNPKLSPDSKEKYEAAKELLRHVDLYYTRETATVDKLFYHRDAVADGLQTEEPVFTFTYRYGNDFIRIRFFTCRMFVTRVEIKENE